VERLQLDEHSWVDVGRAWLPDADALYTELAEAIPWQQSRVFKYERHVDEPRLTSWCRSDASAPQSLLDVQRRIQHDYRVTFDGFSLVWYRDGRDLMAFHRDRDMKWLDETVIAILTLGATRPWQLRPRANRYAHEAAAKGATHDLRPGSGDLLVLGGRTQVGWEHGVPPVREPVEGRISIQWRWTSKRGRQELGGSYRKPQTYAR
jgi:alkylated DNA repair dioxygenase AlkB